MIIFITFLGSVAEENGVDTHEINESAIRNRSLEKWINAVIYIFFERLIVKVFQLCFTTNTLLKKKWNMNILNLEEY